LWLNASILPSPVDFTAGGQFSLQIMDPIRIGPDALHIATTSHSDPDPDVQGASLFDGGVLKPVGWDFVNGQLFDLGQNFAGWCKLSSLNASKSTIIQMRHGELRYQRGTNNITYDGLYYENLFSIAAMDTVILNGTGNETFEPLFTSHGFRYILINGYDKINKSDIECYNAHSETTLIGHFSSASTILNQIQHNILWSQLSNSMSLPYGCPQRNDRTGYLGDAGLSSDVALFNFDYVNFYINFVNMIEDNQTPDGAVSDAVPYMVGQSPADPNWGTAYLTIPWQLYEHTGDAIVIERFYAGVQRWLNCLIGEYQKTGLANMYVYAGDWAPVDKVKNGSLVSSYALLRDVYRFVNMSIVVNRTDNIQRYSQFYQQLAEEYHRVFYNSTVNGYADGCQTANILSLELPNVVPESLRPAVINSLVNSINDVGYFTGGIISTAALFPLLSREGHHDLALKLALLTTYPSYGFMFNNPIQNATTTWEEWNSLPNQAWSSLNHHMFNTIGAWFYRYLAGIELNALKTITIHPRMSYAVDLLNYTEAEVVTLKGPVQVQWTRMSVDSMVLSVTIPNNLDADVLFDPLIKHGRCMKLICDNEIIWMRENQNDKPRLMTNVHGISDLSENSATNVLSLRATSGKYIFMAYWQ
jgi:alpha-L-rhamnosidase